LVGKCRNGAPDDTPALLPASRTVTWSTPPSLAMAKKLARTQPISDQVLGISAERVCGSARLLVGLLVHRVPLLDREGPF
jgi:hypothetical protein